MAEVGFVDTTLRDGQQSLWALGMGTAAMLPAVELLDEAGFDGAEFWVPGVQIKKMIKDLGEDPWPWLHEGSRRAKKTPLRYHGGLRSSGFGVPDAIHRLLVEKAIEHGLSTTRFSDPWNDFDAIADEVDELGRMGMRVVLNLIYSVSPRHTIEHFVERTEAAARLEPYRICLKDVGGLLTLDAARELFPRVVAAAGGIPVEFHAHCNNGLAPLTCLLAVDAGITVLHTAVPPLANGSSNPSVFSVARNLAATGHTPAIDPEPLRRVAAHFEAVAARHGFPRGVPLEYDASQYSHQVPGGMISNLRFQLAKVGMADKLDASLEEAARVRAELGYPIMVTPLSQFVGSQAAINVVTGRRYETVTDGVILYALGRFGAEAPDLMDPGVREKILDRPRTAHLAHHDHDDVSLEELRERFGGAIGDEELITRVCGGYGAEAPITLSVPEASSPMGRHPVIDLLAGVLARPDVTVLDVEKGSFRLRLARRGRPGEALA